MRRQVVALPGVAARSKPEEGDNWSWAEWATSPGGLERCWADADGNIIINRDGWNDNICAKSMA
jgi:hypothetical protein